MKEIVWQDKETNNIIYTTNEYVSCIVKQLYEYIGYGNISKLTINDATSIGINFKNDLKDYMPILNKYYSEIEHITHNLEYEEYSDSYDVDNDDIPGYLTAKQHAIDQQYKLTKQCIDIQSKYTKLSGSVYMLYEGEPSDIYDSKYKAIIIPDINHEYSILDKAMIYLSLKYRDDMNSKLTCKRDALTDYNIAIGSDIKSFSIMIGTGASISYTLQRVDAM